MLDIAIDLLFNGVIKQFGKSDIPKVFNGIFIRNNPNLFADHSIELKSVSNYISQRYSDRKVGHINPLYIGVEDDMVIESISLIYNKYFIPESKTKTPIAYAHLYCKSQLSGKTHKTTLHVRDYTIMEVI